jgi:hypothetical protein
MFDSDYKFYGRHAQYAKFLCKDKGEEKEDRSNLFQREVDVLEIAPLIGIIEGRYVPDVDNDVKDASTIQYATISREHETLLTAYRIVMLSNNVGNYSAKDKVDMAFKFDSIDDKDNPNMKIFNGYVRGGLEFLYEKFAESTDHEKDKKNWICGSIKDLLTNLETSEEYEANM